MEIIRNAIMPGMSLPTQRKWPFSDMNVGDAVKIPDELKSQARNYASSYSQRSGKKFVTRTVAGEMMVYRVS